MRRIGPKDAVGSAAAFLYSLPAWAYPFGNDQALHWYLGKRWLEGELPFVSGISSKPVGMFAVHALSTAIMGDGMWQIRVTESFTVLLIGWLIALAVRPADAPPRDGEMGLAALTFSGAYYTFFDYWDTAHPELWESAAALAAWVVALRARTPWKRDAGAGALATVAFMFKFPAGLPALGIAALCAVRAVRERTDPAPIRGSALALLMAAARFLSGVLPVVALSVLPFALGGKLNAMWEILFVYIFQYAGRAPPVGKIPTWLRIEHGGGFLIITVVLTAIAAVLVVERKDRAARWRLSWLVLAAVLAAGSVVMQNRYFTYHFIAAAAFLAALCVLGITQLARSARGPHWSTLCAVAATVALCFYAGPRWDSGRNQSYASFTRTLIAYERGTVSRTELLRPFVGRRPLDSPLYTEAIAERVNALKQPGDTLCARGFLTPLYPLTGLRCTSRHLNQDEVGLGLPSWRSEYRTALERNPPTFMVTFADRPRDVRYLEGRGYKLVGQANLLRLFTLRDSKTAPQSAAHSGS